MRKQLLVILALMLACVASWAQPLNIGGHRAVKDIRNGIWLCSIPQSQFGTDYSATVSYGDSISQLTIDGVEVPSGAVYTFASVEGSKNYALSFILNDEEVTGNITFTWLPIVELNGNFGYDYQYGDVIVNEPDSAYGEPMMAKLKWRGTVTNVSGKHKRNYRIKFVNSEDSTKENHRFFGLRNDNSWILDAGQMDFLRVRNRVGTDLWLDMARRPWYSDTLPNARNGSRGQMVEVVLNNRYAGIYNMCEPIDRKQLKLKRYDDINDEVRGALWQAYVWSRTVTMSRPKPRGSETSEWDGFEMKYPSFNEIGYANWWPLEDAVYFSGNGNMDPQLRIDSLNYYFDVPVMQDYYILISVLQALDNESLNIFYACYNQQDNPRLTLVPWDLDITLGQSYDPKFDLPNMVKPERHPREWIGGVPLLVMEDLYHSEIIDRYLELRENVLSTESLINRYRTAVEELENCGAAAREEDRWSGDSDLAGKNLDLSAEMDYVEDWIRRHMTYLDERVFNHNPIIVIKGDVNNDREVNIMDVDCVISVILGGLDTYEGRADVNGDGEVNILDVDNIISIILQ